MAADTPPATAPVQKGVTHHLGARGWGGARRAQAAPPHRAAGGRAGQRDGLEAQSEGAREEEGERVVVVVVWGCEGCGAKGRAGGGGGGHTRRMETGPRPRGEGRDAPSPGQWAAARGGRRGGTGTAAGGCRGRGGGRRGGGHVERGGGHKWGSRRGDGPHQPAAPDTRGRAATSLRTTPQGRRKRRRGAGRRPTPRSHHTPSSAPAWPPRDARRYTVFRMGRATHTTSPLARHPPAWSRRARGGDAAAHARRRWLASAGAIHTQWEQPCGRGSRRASPLHPRHRDRHEGGQRLWPWGGARLQFHMCSRSLTRNESLYPKHVLKMLVCFEPKYPANHIKSCPGMLSIILRPMDAEVHPL